MTDRTAAEQAAKALRQFADPENWHCEPGLLQWIGKRSAQEYAADALAALTAEAARVKNPRELTAHFGDPCIYCGIAHDDVAVGPCPARVSPDREALARRLTRLAVVCHAANIGIDGVPGDCLIADALAFIRAPAQAEVEAMAALADARSSDCHIKCTNESLPQWVRDVFKNHANNFSSIAVFLRRLPPAVGRHVRELEAEVAKLKQLCLDIGTERGRDDAIHTAREKDWVAERDRLRQVMELIRDRALKSNRDSWIDDGPAIHSLAFSALSPSETEEGG
jgi:hypothetical protein